MNSPSSPIARRPLLLGACAMLLPGTALAAGSARELGLHNLHTGERVRAVYWADGRYERDALAELSHNLRDFRSGEGHAIEPRLFDFLHALNVQMRGRAELQVISGYRSAKTNSMLRGRSKGVAKKSLHMRGMAIDVRLPDQSLATVRDAAIALRRGGVGFYPKSNFLHLDVGRVRHWG